MIYLKLIFYIFLKGKILEKEFVIRFRDFGRSGKFLVGGGFRKFRRMKFGCGRIFVFI